MMPKLYALDGGTKKPRAFSLAKKTIFIGRSASNDIRIEDPSVSRKHLKVYAIGEMQLFFIEDLNSTNKTFLCGDLIAPGEAFQIDDMDVVTMGNTVLRFKGLPSSDPLNINGLKTQDSKTYRKKTDRSPKQKERRAYVRKHPGFVSNTASLLAQTPSVNQILERTLTYVFNTLPRVDRAAIFLVDGHGEGIKQVISKTRDAGGPGVRRYSKALVKQAVREGKTIKLSNMVYETPQAEPGRGMRPRIRSVLCVPMIRNSKIRGGIYLDSHLGAYDGFRKEDHRLLHSVSDLVARTIENADLLLN